MAKKLSSQKSQELQVFPEEIEKKVINQSEENLFMKDLWQLPSSSYRHDYSNWYLKTYPGSRSFYICYQAKNGSSISVSKSSLISVLESLQKGDDGSKKDLLQFQVHRTQFVNSYASRKKYVNDTKDISYKFVRVNYANRKAVLYQNTFEIKGNSDIGAKLQSFGISLSVEDFLSPLKHIVVPKNSAILETNYELDDNDDI